MIIAIVLLFLFTLCLSYILLFIFSRLFYKLDILDNPKKYWKKRDPIPYWIWIIFFIIFFISSFFFVEYNSKLFLLWLFWALITTISFIDDRLNVSAKIRLFTQILIWAIIWITSIKIWYISNIFWGIINLETYYFVILDYSIYIIPLIFTIIWYVFIFNALNWTDGIEWNTSWLSIISFFILFLLWIILYNHDVSADLKNNSLFIMQTSIIIIAILIPYWYFDIKQKVLMWDSGTMFLWFMLASMAIISWWKIATVLVVFWIYIVDAIYVIIRRIINKKNPLSWDYTHLHHRLLALWLSKNQVLFVVYFLSLFFGITALFLETTWKIIVFIIIIFVVVFINEVINITKNISKKNISKKYK